MKFHVLTSSLCGYKYINKNLKKGQKAAFNLLALIPGDGGDVSAPDCEP